MLKHARRDYIQDIAPPLSMFNLESTDVELLCKEWSYDRRWASFCRPARSLWAISSAALRFNGSVVCILKVLCLAPVCFEVFVLTFAVL